MESEIALELCWHAEPLKCNCTGALRIAGLRECSLSGCRNAARNCSGALLAYRITQVQLRVWLLSRGTPTVQLHWSFSNRRPPQLQLLWLWKYKANLLRSSVGLQKAREVPLRASRLNEALERAWPLLRKQQQDVAMRTLAVLGRRRDVVNRWVAA